MSDTKHTPGPWEVFKLGNDELNTIGGDYIIQSIHEPYFVIADTASGLDDGEQEANARLIAAAPDLLAACKRLSDYRLRAGALHFQLEKADTYIFEMRVAIAKIEGDTE